MGEGYGETKCPHRVWGRSAPPYKAETTAYTKRMSPLQILQHHDITPEDLLHQLRAKADHIPFVLKDDKDNTCFFILRRRGRLFLMAKLSTMTAYEDIYSISGYE